MSRPTGKMQPSDRSVRTHSMCLLERQYATGILRIAVPWTAHHPNSLELRTWPAGACRIGPRRGPEFLMRERSEGLQWSDADKDGGAARGRRQSIYCARNAYGTCRRGRVADDRINIGWTSGLDVYESDRPVARDAEVRGRTSSRLNRLLGDALAVPLSSGFA